MTVRPMILLLAGALSFCACQSGSASPPHRSPPPATALPPAQLRAPADAAISDPEVGLPRLSARDHIPMTEAARDEADQEVALRLFGSWGWAEESTRHWSAGGPDVELELLQTIRPQGARRAFEQWAAAAASAPLVDVACPAGWALDQCRHGRAPGVEVVVGRRDASVFRLTGRQVDVERLAALQARRLVE